MYKNIDKYIELITKNINNHYILGNVINKSVLNDKNNLVRDPHCYYSYLNFIETNPEWKQQLGDFNILNNSINNLDIKFRWNNKNMEENSFTMLHSYN